MVSQSDWFGSWPLLVPKKVKMDPKKGPKSDIFGPKTLTIQHVHNRHRNANYTIIPLIF